MGKRLLSTCRRYAIFPKLLDWRHVKGITFKTDDLSPADFNPSTIFLSVSYRHGSGSPVKVGLTLTMTSAIPI